MEGPSRYYADSGEEPGRWLGHAANESGLTGAVDADDFASVLAGRDPRTGERLITAQGSAGRRKDLGAGNHTRLDPTGIALYGEADAATVLGVTKAEAARMLDVGTLAALSRAVPALGQVTGSYLVPVIDGDGSRWVTEAELSRCEAAREDGIDPEALAAAGTPDDQFPLAEAARLAGTTARYLRTLASRYDKDRERIDASIAAGRRPRQAYLVAHRGTRGQWLVTRQNLTDFLHRRRPPSVRVGYDLTLTTEKSLGVLALLAEPAVGRAVLDAIQTSNDYALGWLEARAALARVGGSQVAADRLDDRVVPAPHLPGPGPVRAPPQRRRQHRAAPRRHPPSTRRPRPLPTRPRSLRARHRGDAPPAHPLQLGVRWRPGRNGGWEIAGIPDAVLREFSRRRNEIDDALVELEEAIGRGAHPNDVEHIVLRTRPAKNHTPAADPRRRLAPARRRPRLHPRTPRRLPQPTSSHERPRHRRAVHVAGRPRRDLRRRVSLHPSRRLAALANHPVPPSRARRRTPTAPRRRSPARGAHRPVPRLTPRRTAR